MGELAEAYGLLPDETERIHRQYVHLVMAAAQRDGAISPSEHELLMTLCRSLNIGDIDLPEPTYYPMDIDLPANAQICFTGETIVDGKAVTRPEMEAIAARNGFQPVRSITRDCKLLVASDPASMSGKAKQARRNGVPIMLAAEFISKCRVKPAIG